MRVEPAAPDDATAVAALVSAQFGDARIGAPLVAMVGSATRAPDDECACLVARDAGGAPAAAVLYGMVAGADGAARVHALAGDRRAADLLVHELTQLLHARGARILVLEWPDLPSLSPLVELLRDHGFEACGRVQDFHDRGIDLLILRAELG